MNIAVIAANGRSGRVLVDAALDAGHTVRAGVHRSHSFSERSGLTVVPCDATKPEEVATLLTGADAVVSLIGHVKGSAPDVQTQAIRTVIEAMPAAGVRRIVSLTGTGVRFPDDRIGLVDRLLNLAVSLVDPERVADGRHHAEVLQASPSDWTLLRVLKLANGNPLPYRLLEHGPARWLVPRSTVAAAVLEVLEKESFIRQAPIIGNKS